MAKQFPAVLITGARQTGKTSLLRQLYPSASYVTLDLLLNAEAARAAPDELLADVVIERAGSLTAIECKCKEHPGDADANGLRALEAAEPRKVKQKMIVCRTKAAYRLPDGTWVMNTADGLKRLASG
jgi:predicted AAA+ superfamily ATPase